MNETLRVCSLEERTTYRYSTMLLRAMLLMVVKQVSVALMIGKKNSRSGLMSRTMRQVQFQFKTTDYLSMHSQNLVPSSKNFLTRLERLRAKRWTNLKRKKLPRPSKLRK